MGLCVVLRGCVVIGGCDPFGGSQGGVVLEIGCGPCVCVCVCVKPDTPLVLRHPVAATAAVGTHPTGMHSCPE